MANVVALIDGFNVYHALDCKSRYGGGFRYNRYKWINYWKLAECFVPKIDVMKEVRWFTAETPWKNKEGEMKRNRHRRLRQVNEDHGVIVVEGYFRPVEKTCRLRVPKASIRYQTYEEKRTDVAIAVSLVSLAHRKAYDKVILLTADSDIIPAIQEAKQVHPAGLILNVLPIERRGRALRNYVDQQMTMKVKHLKASRLPSTVTLSAGKQLTCPSSWNV